MTPEEIVTLLRLIAGMYSQLSALQQENAQQAARIAELEAAEPT